MARGWPRLVIFLPKANRTGDSAPNDTEVLTSVEAPGWKTTFAKIKEFRGIATRYDKTESSYTGRLGTFAARSLLQR